KPALFGTALLSWFALQVACFQPYFSPCLHPPICMGKGHEHFQSTGRVHIVCRPAAGSFERLAATGNYSFFRLPALLRRGRFPLALGPGGSRVWRDHYSAGRVRLRNRCPLPST